MGRSVRTTAFVIFAISTVFIGVDFLSFPERARSFLTVRLGFNVVLGVVFFRECYRHPLASGLVTLLGCGAMLLTLIYGTGGANSEYYTGLVLLFTGMSVLVPLSGVQAAGIVALLFGAFVASPAFAPSSLDWNIYYLHSFFLGAAAFESVVSSSILDRIRFTDFKQRRELERTRDELKELDRTKSRFTANIHHELRTPLTLVLSPLEAMLSGEFGEVSEGARGYLRTMEVNALRLLKLINNLLDLAKAESQELRLRRTGLDPGRVLSDVVAGARPMAERKQIMLETFGLDSLPKINADPDALEKIVMNLVGNALKFTDAKGRIEVTAKGEDDGIRITVSDTGVGLQPNQLDRIFDRFAQVDTSATRKHEGTGIGLSLVKELVQLHGGRVWVESDGLGQGARFHVFLPRGEEDRGLDEQVLRTDTGRGVTLGRSLGALEAELNLGAGSEGQRSSDAYRQADLERTVARWEDGRVELPNSASGVNNAPEVVIAEDNAEMRRLLAHLLSHEFRVREARNGREALEAVRERAPDLVLTDVMMPEMSGTELCRALKSSPETGGIPVVLVTSKAEREMKVQGLELGADDYVTKPFHPRELLARVRSLVRLHGLQAQLEERNRALEEANTELAHTLEDLKAAEVQLVQSERLAAVGELAAGVAHEVNNPVNFALNAVRMLKSHVEGLAPAVLRVRLSDVEDPSGSRGQAAELEGRQSELETAQLAQEVVELVQIATEGLERTQRLVGDLKDFADPQRAARTPIDLARCLRSTVQLLGHSLQRAGVSVDLQIESNLPRVRGHASALSQVFLNLLKNAGEALETRGGRIGLEARREGGSVLVEIRDDGPGVAPEVQSRLFEPFVSTKDAGRGTGLGLSICHRIVTEHGGTLELRSEPGEGAVFMIRLPAEERDAA
jgi:signal transduction histidine kinase